MEDPDKLFAELEQMGEELVRLRLAQGVWSEQRRKLVEYWLDERNRRETPPGAQPQVTIHAQQIGAVMTAGGSTANVTINIGPAERQAVATATAAVRSALDEGAISDEQLRHELREIAAECDQEIDKERPNQSKLRGLLGAARDTLSGVAAASDAYTALKAVLALFGVTL